MSCNNCHNATALLITYLDLVPTVLGGTLDDTVSILSTRVVPSSWKIKHHYY